MTHYVIQQQSIVSRCRHWRYLLVPPNALRLSAILMYFFGALTASLARAQQPLADEVNFQLDWLPGGDKAPIYVAQERGFFREYNLKVSVSSGRGSSDAITKLATGSADIGTSGLGALLAAKAQGTVPVVAIYSIFTKAPHAFIAAGRTNIKTIADLAGKKVATSPFTSSNVYLPLVLEANDLSESDIQLLKTDPGALGPLLAHGRVDAVIAWSTDIGRYRDQLLQVGDSAVLLPWAEAGMDMYGISLLANTRFLQQRPDVARRFIAAYDKALKFVHHDPELAAEDVHASVPEIDTTTALSAINEFRKLAFNPLSQQDGLGSFTPERVTNTWRWVSAAQKLDPVSLDPEAAINRRFLPTASSPGVDETFKATTQNPNESAQEGP